MLKRSTKYSIGYKTAAMRQLRFVSKYRMRLCQETEIVYLPQNNKKNIQNHTKYINSGRLPDR